MAEGSNSHKGPGKENVGTLGDVGTADGWGRDPTGRYRMGDNYPHTKRERGVSSYRTRGGGVKVLCNSGEFSVEAGGRLAQRLARV